MDLALIPKKLAQKPPAQMERPSAGMEHAKIVLLLAPLESPAHKDSTPCALMEAVSTLVMIPAPHSLVAPLSNHTDAVLDLAHLPHSNVLLKLFAQPIFQSNVRTASASKPVPTQDSKDAQMDLALALNPCAPLLLLAHLDTSDALPETASLNLNYALSLKVVKSAHNNSHLDAVTDLAEATSETAQLNQFAQL